MAVMAVSEIDSLDRAEAGVPLTLPLRTGTGGERHVEVAALPLHDLGIEGLIALRLRVADACCDVPTPRSTSRSTGESVTLLP